MPNAAKLKAKIKEQGKTQAWLADKVGINRCYMSTICNHDLNMTERILKDISKALNCKIDDIV